MKKRILNLLEVDCLLMLNWILDVRIWLLNRVIRLTEASISLLNTIIDRTSEKANEPARVDATDEPKGDGFLTPHHPEE